MCAGDRGEREQPGVCLSSLSSAAGVMALNIAPAGYSNCKSKVIEAKVSFALMEQTSGLNNPAY